MRKAIAVMATLDTKGPEALYLSRRIRAGGGRPLVIDMGMGGTPYGVRPNISREAVARAAGTSARAVRMLGRGAAVEVMQRGLAKILTGLHARGELAGALAIGGSDGAVLAASAMHALPFGVPKMIVSPATQGQTPFGPYVGSSDIVIRHSVVDILGINQLSRVIFDQSAAAVLAMAEVHVDLELRPGKVIAATMYGNTTPAVMLAKKVLERRGYEVIVFHPNGTGGQAMESLIAQGLFEGVLDYTTHEITDHLFGGFHSAGPGRLEAAGRLGLPQLVVPGCVDFLIRESQRSLPARYRRRKSYHFNPVISLVRTSRAEMRSVARAMAGKLNAALGPVTLLIPRRGFSMYAGPGGPLRDVRGDAEFIRVIETHLSSGVRVVERDAHINDPRFARLAVSLLLEMLAKTRKR
jgi:uncharacterized protein (UPF0261 family)